MCMYIYVHMFMCVFIHVLTNDCYSSCVEDKEFMGGCWFSYFIIIVPVTKLRSSGAV